MKVGDKVTRNTIRNSSKVWEIAEASTAGEVFDSPMAIKAHGGPESAIYRLKDAETGKIQRNLWWSADELTEI